MALTGEGLGVVPELIEAWHYGRFALVSAALAGGRRAGARDRRRAAWSRGGAEWAEAVRALPPPEALAARARAGTEYAAAHGTWPRVAQRTSEAIDEMAALDDGRPRAALRAQIAYLYPLVQRQRRAIEAMRVSRFWRLRDAWFALRRRLGITTAADPIPVPGGGGGGESGVELAALGDPYQLFREQHRLRREDVERYRTTLRFLPRPVRFGLVVDLRGRDLDGLRPALRSLRDQVYPYWTARILVGADVPPDQLAELHAVTAEDPRLALVEPGGEWFGEAEFVGPLDPHDRLEPHALFECALALQDGDADVRLLRRGPAGRAGRAAPALVQARLVARDPAHPRLRRPPVPAAPPRLGRGRRRARRGRVGPLVRRAAARQRAQRADPPPRPGALPPQRGERHRAPRTWPWRPRSRCAGAASRRTWSSPRPGPRSASPRRASG